MNLLDHFILQHCQISLLRGELLRVSREGTMQDAKVEMNLTPRLMEMDSGERLPSYQVSARLTCIGGAGQDSGPAFKAKVGLETVYQQTSGDPIDISGFMGLSNIQLPFDLNPDSQKISVSPEEISDRVH